MSRVFGPLTQLESRDTPAVLSSAFQDVPTLTPGPNATPTFTPTAYRPLQIDTAGVLSQLSAVPSEPAYLGGAAPVVFTLPMPDGQNKAFTIVDAPVMAPGLAAQFPDIHTYQGRGVDDPTAILRMDVTPLGFHAMVTVSGGTWLIDPAFGSDTRNYMSYFRGDATRDAANFVPMDLDGGEGETAGRGPAGSGTGGGSGTAARSSGTTLRTYRLAVAATGEYTQAVGGGTVAGGQAAIVTAVNRVDGVYESEFAIRMVLIANNSSLVYTDGNSDPYTNDDGPTMLGENQANVDSIIGNGNYDIGHVFSTGGGGIAGLGVVGNPSRKAQGVTGLPNPIGDPFYIDYVAHEMGHQYGGNHTFNTAFDPNRNASTAYEPGSGSTIMAYAGLEGTDDIQPNSDPYFHSASFDEVIALVDDVIPSVGTRSSTGNTPPTVSAGSNYVIPARTPFALTATGSDVNNDTLTYSWEERDLGPADNLSDPDNGQSPLFRFVSPTTDPTRTFPNLNNLLSNTTSPNERMPTVSRAAMNFRVTARDNRIGGGGVDSSDMSLQVVDTGAPFRVTTANTTTTWLTPQQTITWDVAGTTGNGINAANVDIYLSTDGGLTFPTKLATATANDGTETLRLPTTNTTQARIKVQGSNNVFFDINDVNFTVIVIGNTPPMITSDGGGDTATVQAFENKTAVTTVTATDDETPFGLTYALAGGADAGRFTINAQTGKLSFAAAPNFENPADANRDNQYIVNVKATDLSGEFDTQTLTVIVNDVNEPPTFTLASGPSALEDAGAKSFSSFVSNIVNEPGQTVTFTVNVTGTTGGLTFTAPPAIDGSGKLTFTASPNANGTATVTVYAQDSGGTDNGGNDTSATQTFTLTVVAVNDAPSFVVGPDQYVATDAGPQTVTGFITTRSAGPPDEAGQTLSFFVTTDRPTLFTTQPSVAADGTLTYTPAPGVIGLATVTVNIQDSGGTANGGVNRSLSQTFLIAIGDVNLPPKFDLPTTLSDTEDAPARSLPNVATNISAGRPSESGQTITFAVSVNNPALFAVQPAIDAGGTLTYTLAPDANGTATLRVVATDDGGTTNGGIDTSVEHFLTLTVVAVNDAPSLAVGAGVVVTEDAGPQSQPAFVTAISAGPPDEFGQTITLTVSNDNPGLFLVAPSIDLSGRLTFTAAPDAFGTAVVSVFAQDNGGGTDTSAVQTFTVTINGVNDAPSFVVGPNQKVAGDAGPQTLAGFATGVSAGPPNEAAQTVSFVVTASKPSFFLVQPAVDSNGTLTYTPMPNVNGTVVITVTAVDDGGTANGGVSASPSQAFVIDVTSFADPVIAPAGTVEDTLSGPIVLTTGLNGSPVAFFQITNIRGGVLYLNDGTTPVADGQFIPVADGQTGLKFRPFADQNDASTPGGFGFSVQNSTAATAAGLVKGVVPVNIAVAPVNDLPTYFSGTSLTVNEDAGFQALSAFAIGIGAGPVTATDEAAQPLTFALTVLGTTDGLTFVVPPAIDANGTLTFQTAPDANGTATVQVTLNDGNGGTTTTTLLLTVAAVNDAPTATVLVPVTNAPGTGPQTIPNVATVGTGAANEFDTLQISVQVVSTTPNVAFVVPPSIDLNGTLTYTAVRGSKGTATLLVRVFDGQLQSSAQTITLNIDATNHYELVGYQQFAVGSDDGRSSAVLYNDDRSVRFGVVPNPGNTTIAVRTATADFNGDGVADLVTGTGPGAVTGVTIVDGVSRAVLYSLQPFEATFTGGVYVAAGDLNGDGVADLVITPDEGGGPRVIVIDGRTFVELTTFFAINDPAFRGGARPAVGDLTGDGIADLIVSAGFGGGPRIAGYDGTTLATAPRKIFNDFFAFEQTLRNGAFVTVGDLDGDGVSEVIVGGGPGGAPRVVAFSGRDLIASGGEVLIQTLNTFVGDPNDRGGVRLAVKDLDGDNRADLVVGVGRGGGSTVSGYLGKSLFNQGLSLDFSFRSFDDFSGGVFVG